MAAKEEFLRSVNKFRPPAPYSYRITVLYRDIRSGVPVLFVERANASGDWLCDTVTRLRAGWPSPVYRIQVDIVQETSTELFEDYQPKCPLDGTLD